MKLTSLIKRLPKRLIVGSALVFAAIALPLQSVMADTYKIESSVGVRNISVDSSSANLYQESTNATYDQVVEFRVYYHNMEEAGSSKIAENVRVKVDFPTEAGKSQVVKTTVSADNTNTVVDTATVNLDRADAYIQFVPGSVKWDHNPANPGDARITEAIADSKILNGDVLENEKPCYDYQAYVRFQARVIIPSVGVYKTVRETPAVGAPKPVMQQSITSTSGTTLDYVVSTKNLSNSNLTNVYLRDQMPSGIEYVAGSAKKVYGQYNGTVMADSEVDAFFNGKKNVGTLLPGATAYIVFQAKVADASKLVCGLNTIKNIAVVDTDQTGPYNNNAVVTVNKECVPEPLYKCDLLTINKTTGRGIAATVKYTVANGATFKNVDYQWGDNTNIVTSNVTNVAHTYAQDGNYAITTVVHFNVNGYDKSANCTGSVTFETPQTPAYSCDLLTINKTGVRTIKAAVTYTAKNGATFKNVDYQWGDNTSTETTNVKDVLHTFVKDGKYTITTVVHFNVNGYDKSANCTGSVTFETPQTPAYSCDLLNINKLDGRKVDTSIKYTATGGATLKDVTYEWGDGNQTLTDKTSDVAHTYAKDGEYKINATVRFNVGGAVKSSVCMGSVNFQTPVTPPEVPTVLVNTGAGDIVGLFAGASAFGAVAYQFAARRNRS